jgi:drug/metabolite transporter (DMT)-like permease
MPYATLAAMAGQLFISLYPILIKSSNATFAQQIAGRFGVFSILPILLGGSSVLSAVGGSVAAIAKTFAAGSVNIFHVFESYKSFQLLPAGVAYTILYTYPFWNLLGAKILFGEAIPPAAIPLFLAAFAGIILIAYGSSQMRVKSEGHFHEPGFSTRGFFAAFAGAITETLLYLIVRGSEFTNPLQNIGRLYIGAALVLLVGTAAVSPTIFSTLSQTPKDVPLFNAFVGFTSMSALMWAAKKIPTYVYSLIAFIGMVASYMWGALFAGEIPSPMAIVGSLLIGISNFYLYLL